MISRNELKFFGSLLQKKYRRIHGKFLTEGKKTIHEAMNSDYKCDVVIFTEKFQNNENEYIQKLKSKRVRLEKIKSANLRFVTDTKSPEGIAAVFNSRELKKDFSEIDDPLMVYLESISDPGNIGTIIRNCDWFGIKNILLSKDCVELYNPKVIRASMGSIFHIDIHSETALSKLIPFRKNGYEFLCAGLSGTSIDIYKKSKKIILFLSNESTGPSKELLSLVDKSVTIPGSGKAESLNVASSSAILLAKLTEQN